MVALNTENYWILSNSYKLQAISCFNHPSGLLNQRTTHLTDKINTLHLLVLHQFLPSNNQLADETNDLDQMNQQPLWQDLMLLSQQYFQQKIDYHFHQMEVQLSMKLLLLTVVVKPSNALQPYRKILIRRTEIKYIIAFGTNEHVSIHTHGSEFISFFGNDTYICFYLPACKLFLSDSKYNAMLL